MEIIHKIMILDEKRQPTEQNRAQMEGKEARLALQLERIMSENTPITLMKAINRMSPNIKAGLFMIVKEVERKNPPTTTDSFSPLSNATVLEMAGREMLKQATAQKNKHDGKE